VAVWSRSSSPSSIAAFADVESLRAELEQTGALAERLNAALQVVGNGVVVWDEFGNSVFTDLDTVVEQSPATTLLLNRAISEALTDALRGEETARHVDVFGPPKRMLFVTARTVMVDGVRRGGVAVVNDVTERERTEAIRRDFVTNVSHELRTPVGALSVLAETLRDELFTPDRDPSIARRLVDRIESESHRLSRLIDDLLELDDVAQRRIESQVVQLAGCVSEAAAQVRAAAEVAQVELSLPTISVLPDTLTVEGDRRQLISAIFNLLDNAVKYSDAGSAVEVMVRRDGGVIHLDIVDTGIGIPLRDRERIFERFYRVDRARSRARGGSGLGLSIVRNIARAHGGDVTVRSVEGHGSTFTLSLPLAQVQPILPAPPRLSDV
jgi:two-component system, OmpR family, sensor histidine kinase SenX3